MSIFSPRATAPLRWIVVGLLVVNTCAYSVTSRPGAQNSEQGAANRSADPVIEVSPSDADSPSDDPCSEMFSNLFVDVDSIAYNGYEIVRLHKTIHDKEYGADVTVSYAVLKSSQKTIATFEGVYFGAGNETDFGFASLLGGETKQLVVSQSVARGGRQWIVDLSSGARTVFDSADWDLGEEDVCFHDFDGDGVAELSLAIGKFCGIGTMSMVECPMIGVDFKYDSSAKKYLPDRLAFGHELDGIEVDAEKIDPAEIPGGLTGPYLAKRLDIFLRYAYGGREHDGWVFFDRNYNLPDKKETEQKIRAALQQEPIYKFVYGKKSRLKS